MKSNYILWAIAFVLVNSGWYIVSQQSASQEINRPGAEFAENRDAELTSLVGDESEYELEHCFESKNGEIYNVSIEVWQGSELLYDWNGTTDDSCVTYSDVASDGDIVVLTSADESVDVTTTIRTWPMKDALIPGVVMFSLGTIVVAYGEKIIRKIITKRLENTAQESEIQPSDSYDAPSGIWQEPVRPN